MADPSSHPSPTLSALLSSSSSTSTFDASTQLSTNRAVGTLLDNLSGGNTDVVSALNDIASAITSSIIGGSTGSTANALLRANGTGGLSLKSGVITEDDSGNLANINSLSLALPPNQVVVSGTVNPGALTTLASGTAGQLLTSNGAALPSFQSFVDGIGGLIQFPSVQNYRVWLFSPFGGTITSFSVLCTSGSCTVQLRNNLTTLTTATVTTGGSIVSVSSSFSPGDSLLLNVTSNSGCQNFSFMIAFTRP